MNLPLPLVSVIIPCFNKSASIARTIASVKAQTLNNLECIIVDDGSTDNSKDVILEAVKDDWRFRYVRQDNQRVAAARNRGFKESRGLYICCVDGDDAILPTFLEVCVKPMEVDKSLGITYTGLYSITPDGNEGVSPWPGQFSYDAMLAGQNQIPTCNVARREVWERTGGQRGRYCMDGAGEEDAEMWLRAGALGWNAKKVTEEALFVYSWKSGQVSGNPNHKVSDWRAGKPWAVDRQHPFASLATPANKLSHPVRQYDQPTISVVIPCGPSHQRYLVDALDSLEAQTFRQWEAIVTCDGWQVGDELRSAYPFVKWINLDSKGAGAARNAGAKFSRAPYLLFLDADDWLRPTALEKLLAAWNQTQAIAYSDYAGHAHIEDKTEIAKLRSRQRLESYNERTHEAVVLHQSFEYDCVEAMQQPKITRNGEFYIWNLITSLLPKAWHDAIGGFDEQMPSWEDWDYWLRLARSGRCFSRVPEPLIDYRLSTGTRRETGRQIHQSLLEYMTAKYREIPVMPCGSCGGRRQSAVAPQQVQAAPQMSAQMSADSVVWVRLNDGNTGQHPIVGNVTRTQYGYRSHGDLFKMIAADAAAAPHKYAIVPNPETQPAQVVKTETPEPIPQPL